jgi:hypothetical protein
LLGRGDVNVIRDGVNIDKEMLEEEGIVEFLHLFLNPKGMGPGRKEVPWRWRPPRRVTRCGVGCPTGWKLD